MYMHQCCPCKQNHQCSADTTEMVYFKVRAQTTQSHNNISLTPSLSNGDFYLNTRLNTDGRLQKQTNSTVQTRKHLKHRHTHNLSDNLRGTVKIDDPLVYPHLVPVPRLRTLSTWRLAASETKVLCWHSDWTLHLQLLVLGSTDQVRAYCHTQQTNIQTHYNQFSARGQP